MKKELIFIVACVTFAYGQSVPDMIRIPAGSFLMGDHTGGSIDGTAMPVHTVYVSEFHIDKYEVYWSKWIEVCTWASSHGYSFSTGQKDHAEVADAINRFPVVGVSWVDAVKWCNAYSEMLGLTPCYFTSTAKVTIYRTGTLGIDYNCVNWSANGVRLPTEAEWEKAARGGLVQNWYPWPSTTNNINGSMANFKGSGDPYNDAAAGEDDPKQTTPVGYYNGSQTPSGADMKNGYGLYDIAGNAAEWCFDKGSTTWYSDAGATADDCRGPLTTSGIGGRVWRGSSFDDNGDLQCANRKGSYVSSIAIDYGHIDFGFRIVRNSNSSSTDVTPPTAPTGLASSNIGATSATLSWTASTDNAGVTGYEVFSGSVSLGTTASTSLSISDLTCEAALTLTVKAHDAAGNWSAASAPLSVATTACVAGAEVIVNDDSPRITYAGSWTSGSYDTDPGNINKDEHLTNATNDFASFTFTGSSISWIGTSSANRGIVDVYIDNVKVASVDVYSSSFEFQKVLYVNSSLSNGPHTIKLVNTGTKNTSSSGTYLIVDAFKYNNPGTTRTIGSRYLKSFQQQSAFVTAQGMVTINLSSTGFTRVRIADSNGRLVYSTIAAGKLIMSASAIKPGVYFVSEQCDGVTRIHKVAISQ